MLQHAGCQFHIASGLGRWHCVPLARSLLKHAIPGDWVVDEVIEGRWTRDDTDIRIIKKTTEGATLTETIYNNQVTEEANDGELDSLVTVEGTKPRIELSMQTCTYDMSVDSDGNVEY